MAEPKASHDPTVSYTLVEYENSGGKQKSQSISVEQLDAETISLFSKKTARLSGDLDLPFESKLPGNLAQMDYRIGTDGSGAYVLYYFHDEVIFAALFLPGKDVEQELELTQVFKFLLLDTNDLEEPSEEEIEELLSADEFDFDSVSERPVVFTIPFAEPSEESVELEHAKKMNQHLAAAFFGR